MPEWTVLIMAGFSIVIFVTNLIILECFSAQFVHPGALLPFYLFLEHKNSESSTFLFDYNDARAFKVFKSTAGCIFKCETKKMKAAKNI